MIVYSLQDTWSDNAPRLFKTVERAFGEIEAFKREFPDADVPHDRFEILALEVIE